jgi:hypothetical protein
MTGRATAQPARRGVRSRSTRRAGKALAEVALSLPATVLIAGMLIGTVVGWARLAARAAVDEETRDAAWTAATVLGAELRSVHGPGDIRAAVAESVAIRAFRGNGIVCRPRDTSAHVAWLGRRLPDPAKDSVLILGPDGERAARLVAAGTDAGCATGGRRGLRLDTGGPLPAGTLVLVFETGAYHLDQGTLRYRSGAAGRQPVTAAVLGASRFHVRPDGSGADLMLQAAPPGEAGSQPLRIPLPGAASPHPRGPDR